jgi:hypothetical protein
VAVRPISEMLDTIFRLFDESWFGLLLSTALALYSVYLTVRLSSRHQLSFLTAEGTVLEPAHPSWTNDLKIHFQGVEIPRLTATRIGVWNSGNSTILGNQIVRDDPLRFEVKGDDQILKFYISGVSRSVVKATASLFSTESIAVDFDFLDPGDGFVIFVAHTSPLNAIRSSGTVRGLMAGATPWTRHNAYRVTVANNVLSGPASILILYLIFSAGRKLAAISEGSTASFIITIAYLILVGCVLFFSKNVAQLINSFILRRVPKVISQEEGLRIRLMQA